MDNLEKIGEIVNYIRKNKSLEEIDISHDLDLRENIGFDSFDLAELTVRIEAVYDIDIFKDGIVNTIGEILNIVEKK